MGGARFLAGFLLAVLGLAQDNDLLDAARRGDLTKLRTMVGNKANIDFRDAHGRTALHEAAANCQMDAYRFLVQAGWDFFARDDQGTPAVTLAVQCLDRNATVAPPRPSAASNVPVSGAEDLPWSLQYATAHKQAGVLSMVLNMGADVNAVGSDGNRALDIACLKGDAASARILLEHGANPSLRNKTGSTPLHDAALSGNKEVVEMLLARGADVSAQDPESKSTPLHYAASFGRLEAVRTLVEHGADVSARDSKGQTALQLAISNQQEEVSAFLRSLGSAK
jgi:ankyrin repeat protein